jgi:PqqD family protein of HPr-rel-A system
MAGPLYFADPIDAADRVELDGLTALFHARSGTTHILAAPAPQILDALADGPADAEAVLARLGERFEVAAEEGGIEARLAELEAAGLVRRA